MDIEVLCDKVRNIAISTGKYLREEQRKFSNADVLLKGVRNYVTYIDKEAEQNIVKSLTPLLPEASFLTEEKTVEYTEKEFTWIIDPLDGTTNFIHKDTPYSVSIALQQNKKTILGVVFDPVADELFSATAQQGAKLNGNLISVNNKNELINSYLAFGIPYSLDEKGLHIIRNAIEQFKNCSFRIKGSAALEICYVACGRCDCYFHSGLSAWDVAAGTFILECAGGKCTDFSDSDNYIFGRELVASNRRIHPSVMHEIIR